MNPILIDFVVKRTMLKASDVIPELKLSDDIGLIGMDAVSFFEEFFEEFKIKNLEDFDFDLHIDTTADFAPQPFNWIKNIVLKNRRKYLKPDVSLGHLQRVIERGKWFSER